ncbi:unnamed protein product [Acanthoscelides obtectus]|uniref:DUF7869 domain-containing protein n=1 Tax=Acanthoscelides obtectus TaxID=200917 RepID=A0A9P0Q7Q7_ACAOB|nr:unnamed protein product [Acanthoscelides obtectus]CAK1677780.1 hypothetical protein AOBTE_LOCUS31554 [Acanthoscelides obtectus]
MDLNTKAPLTQRTRLLMQLSAEKGLSDLENEGIYGQSSETGSGKELTAPNSPPPINPPCEGENALPHFRDVTEIVDSFLTASPSKINDQLIDLDNGLLDSLGTEKGEEIYNIDQQARDTLSHIREAQNTEAEFDDVESPCDDSDADPDYVSSASAESPSPELSNFEEPKAKKPRRRKMNVDAWQKNIAKRQRNRGLEYISSSSKRVIKSREMGPPCQNCRLKCNEKISSEERKLIFSDYWSLGDLQRQRDYLAKCMESVTCRYQYKNSRRASNNAFYFFIRGTKIRICKHFFRATLGITDRPIRTVLEKQRSFTKGILSGEQIGKHGNHHRVDDDIKTGIRNHINSIPRIESHYCTKDSNREYIEGGKTVAQLHRDYVESCKQAEKPYGNYLMYSRRFNPEFNISFFLPKKDQCTDCVAFQMASGEDRQNLVSDYETHIAEKDLSRQEKKEDKENSESNVIVAVYDLQAVLQCPRGETSPFYYCSKLNVFNFTIYELKTKDVQCYMWDESEGNRGVCEIGTCVLNYIESLESRANQMYNKKIDLIFYSDNCCGQQKNHVMFKIYHHAVQKYNFINSITHKFLIKGHTQNEGDSVHSVIERHVKRSLKSGPIFIPAQYVTIIRTSKVSGSPYRVHELNHEDFLDLKDFASTAARSFTKNDRNESIKIADIKVVKADKNNPNKILYKASYADEYQTIDIGLSRYCRRRNVENDDTLVIKKLYRVKPGITEKKKSSILSLFNQPSSVIPKTYFQYYSNL